jgi:hypothetical protein
VSITPTNLARRITCGTTKSVTVLAYTWEIARLIKSGTLSTADAKPMP